MMSTSLSPTTPASSRGGGGGGGVWEVEADISALLSRHSVEEVRKIEQKTRLDIERKKEELRQMVGERYRDLIDAADSIIELETNSKQVRESLGHMIRVCQNLQQTHFLRGLGGMKGPLVTDPVTTQMQLLGDTPHKIWKSLEKREYQEATGLYLTARHMHTQLQISLARCSLLQKIWLSTSGFKTTILECCKKSLQVPDQNQSAIVSSLCSIVMLETCSLRQVFSQFLLSQKVAIQTVFHPSKQMHSSVKSQLTEVLQVIRRSIILISAIFCLRPSQGTSLLLEAVKNFTKDLQKVSVVTATQRTTPSEVPLSDIQTSCEEWLTACVEDVKKEVKPLLSHVTSVKALSNIRLSLHSLLSKPEEREREITKRESTSWQEEWRELSRRVVARDNLCIWQLFLRELFFSRAKDILTKQFKSSEEQALNSLHNLLDNLTSDPSRYSHDVDITSQLWVEESVGGRERGEERRTGTRKPVTPLTLKTKGCTPNVYRYCEEVGELLHVIVEEVSHYISPPPPPPLSGTSRAMTRARYPSTSTSMGQHHHITHLRVDEAAFPFSVYGDQGPMREFVKTSTIEFTKRYVGKVQRSRDEMESLLVQQDDSNRIGPSSLLLVDRLLTMARVCQVLSDFCTPLSLLSNGCTPPLSTPQSSVVARQKKRTSKQKEEDSETNTVELLLHHERSSIHKIWAETTAQQFVSSYREQLLNSSHLNILSCSLVWDEVTIQEEAEGGKQVSSLIKVPSQASVYVTSLLFGACQEISRIGGHTMERNMLQQFTGRCLRGVLDLHLFFLKETSSIHQNCALQLLFNMRFLCSVLSSPPDMEEETGKLQQMVLEQIHSRIDPFDLSVFTPHLLSGLERQLSRSTVLLGVLLALRGSAHHLMSGRKPSSSVATQEKHIVLPLFPSVPRFASLPVSSPSVKTKLSHQLTPVDAKSTRTFSETLAFFHHM